MSRRRIPESSASPVEIPAPTVFALIAAAAMDDSAGADDSAGSDGGDRE